MRLCQAYLLEKVGIDYNYWSKTVNANHKNVEIDFENAGEFENAKKTKVTKPKKTVSIEDIRKVNKRKRTEEEDLSDDEEEEMLRLLLKKKMKKQRKPVEPENEEEENSSPKTSSKTPAKTPAKTPRKTPAKTPLSKTPMFPNTPKSAQPLKTPIMRTISLQSRTEESDLRRTLFTRQATEQSPGTPKDTEEESESEIDDVTETEETVEIKDTIEDLHEGKQNLTLVVTNVRKVNNIKGAKAGVYRASVADGKEIYTTNVIFHESAETEVKKKTGPGKSYIMKLIDTCVYDKAKHVIGIIDFEILGEINFDMKSYTHISEAYLLQLRGVRGVSTPTRMKHSFL